MRFVNIYTDGACSGNQNDENFGGWGAILEYGEHKKEIFGGEKNTTNNKMELIAVAKALEALKREGLHINIFSDSSYLVECFTKKWYVKWMQNGWKTSQKTPVENQELWEKLINLIKKHSTVNFYRVKGHINLNNESQIEKWFNKFKSWNGNSFTKEDFLYITKMNIRADELANMGIDSIRKK
ncbi:RNase H family protein [Caminicella sporogenes]|uniref:RNase H family protein n=1 Tax=Caminicella sporogenes TaxID=166485 RepID=UPI00254040AC|nr:RNase H family protein [Caminicella sporogenes]WIF95967.1 ribonuclease HI [Caminicella sporogenes]